MGDVQDEGNLPSKNKTLKNKNMSVLVFALTLVLAGLFIPVKAKAAEQETTTPAASETQQASAEVQQGEPVGAPAISASQIATNNLAKAVIENVAPIVETKPQDETSVPTIVPEDFIQKPLMVETEITPQDLPRQLPLARPVQTPVQRANAQTSAPARTAPAQPAPVQAQAQAQATAKASAKATAGHRFPYGYCTYFVAQKRLIPWGGNAITWLSGAKSFGFATGKTPKAGAVVVTNEGGSAGHVAYVEAVSGANMTVSEMNYTGFGVVSKRTIPVTSTFILGYIY